MHLRSTRAIRRSRHATMKRSGLGKFNDAVSIRDRPAEVEDRAAPGHWEGDLIAGSGNSFIATLVERNTRFVMLAKVGNKDSHSVIQALIKQSRKLPKELYRSLTWDRGSEIAGHKKFTLATDIDVYLCEPHSPWQRGSNENTNGLLRQYFPKGTDLSIHSQAKLSAVARQLNERPRMTLGYPAEYLCLITTAHLDRDRNSASSCDAVIGPPIDFAGAANVGYAGCDRSILTERRRSGLGGGLNRWAQHFNL